MHVKEINRINYACLHRVWIFASLDLVKPIIIASCRVSSTLGVQKYRIIGLNNLKI